MQSVDVYFDDVEKDRRLSCEVDDEEVPRTLHYTYHTLASQQLATSESVEEGHQKKVFLIWGAKK